MLAHAHGSSAMRPAPPRATSLLVRAATAAHWAWGDHMTTQRGPSGGHLTDTERHPAGAPEPPLRDAESTETSPTAAPSSTHSTLPSDPLRALRLVGEMHADLAHLADVSGIPLPRLGATLTDFAAFVAQLPPEQAAAAFSVLKHTNDRLAAPEASAPPVPPRGDARPTTAELDRRRRELSREIDLHLRRLGRGRDLDRGRGGER